MAANGNDSVDLAEAVLHLKQDNLTLTELIQQSYEQQTQQCRLIEKYQLQREREYQSMQQVHQQAKDVVTKLKNQISEKDEKIKEMSQIILNSGFIRHDTENIRYPPTESNMDESHTSLSKMSLMIRQLEADKHDLLRENTLLKGKGSPTAELVGMEVESSQVHGRTSDDINYFQQIRELEMKLQELVADNEDKDRIIEQNNTVMSELQTKLSQAQEMQNTHVLQLTQSYQQKEDNLLKQLENVSRELEKGKPGQSVTEINTLKKQMVSLVQDLQQANGQLQQLSKEKNELRDRCYVFENKAKVSKAETDDLRQKDDMIIHELRKKLDELQNRLKQKEADSLETGKRLQAVTARYEQIQRSVQMGSAIPSNNGDQFEKIRALQEELDIAKAEKNSLDSELEAKQKKISHLMADYERVLNRTEALENENTLLKFQAETYKADFDAERSEREKKAGDMDMLRENISELQFRNQQLQDEISALIRQAAFTHRSRPQTVAASSSMQDVWDGPTRKPVSETSANMDFLPYRCVCGKGFPEFDLFLSHQNTCQSV